MRCQLWAGPEWGRKVAVDGPGLDAPQRGRIRGEQQGAAAHH